MMKLSMKSKFDMSDMGDNIIHDIEEHAYVSRKIFKIRWKPEGLDELATSFITGSYDNPRSNGLDLWTFSSRLEPELQNKVEFAPEHQDRIDTKANVTDFKFLDDNNHFAYCTNSGNVGVVKVNPKEMIEKIKRSSEEWYGGNISCSSLDTYENTLAVSSRDGKICLMNVDNVLNSGNIDGSVPVNSIKFISKDELLTGSLLGSVSLWDTRTNTIMPSQSFPLCRSQRVGVTCLTSFPTERHMIVCGGRNGQISVFDARNLPIPVRVFNTTDDPLSELCFHPTRHSMLFSVSNRGTIWQWANFFQLFDSLRKQQHNENVDQSLLLEHTNSVIPDVKCLLNNSRFFTNCIDMNRDRLLCGTDNECIIAVKSLQLK